MLGLANVQVIPDLWGPKNSLHNSAITFTLGYGFGVSKEHPSRYHK